MNILIIVILGFSLVILTILLLNILVRLLTHRGRLTLKSYWKDEWVSISETKFLYKFDFFGNISNMKVKDEHTLEVVKEFYKKWDSGQHE